LIGMTETPLTRALLVLVGFSTFAAACDRAMDAGEATPLLVPSGARILASRQQSPVSIAVDGTNVYWLTLGTTSKLIPTGKSADLYSDGQVLACAISGCMNAPTVLASGRTQTDRQLPVPLVTDGTNVYWSDQTPLSAGGLWSCSVAGCNDSPQMIGSALPEAMAIYGGALFWTELAAEVFTCPVSDCSAPTALWSAGFSPCATGVVADASGVYWPTVATESIMKCAAGGCANAPTVVMSTDSAIAGEVAALEQITTDADHVYFTDGNPQIGMILACAKSGCGPQPILLAGGLNAPMAIATDGVDVYWTETGEAFVNGQSINGAGLVRRCAVGGCNGAPVTIASGLTAPVGIAVDDNNVYWAEAGTGAADGRIWIAPK
jgi:hypothetical protein